MEMKNGRRGVKKGEGATLRAIEGEIGGEKHDPFPGRESGSFRGASTGRVPPHTRESPFPPSEQCNHLSKPGQIEESCFFVSVRHGVTLFILFFNEKCKID